MPIINVITWPTPERVKEKMMIEITRVMHEVTGAPLDKITVLVQEVGKESWCEAGILGNDSEFPTKSRRKEY